MHVVGESRRRRTHFAFFCVLGPNDCVLSSQNFLLTELSLAPSSLIDCEVSARATSIQSPRRRSGGDPAESLIQNS